MIESVDIRGGTMDIKLGRLAASRDAINDITSVKLPARTALALARFKKAIEPDTIAFDEARINVLGPYANEEGVVAIPPDKMAEVTESLDELLDEDIEVEFEQLNLEDLVDYWEKNDVAITVDSLLIADFLFEDL